MSGLWRQGNVVIAGREGRIAAPPGTAAVRIARAPRWLKAQYDAVRHEIVIEAMRPGRGAIDLEVTAKDGAGQNDRTAKRRLRVAAFAERETFLVTALSCNVHEGWDPSLHDRFPHPECCGPDKRGHAFPFVVNMERILHGAGLPITWMIDPPVARERRAFFRAGRRRHGDEIALMPSSVSHFNPINYNTERTLAETQALLREGQSALENIFGERVTTIAIDQFIGSVGTNFTLAAAALGANALWGVGFDHWTCDTSMFHGGCPWNPYRPRRDNFRAPGGPDGDPLPLWMFQWTFRDVINTLYVDGPAKGSTMFSTDVDDILLARVDRCEPDYYRNLARELLANRAGNEMLVMTIHQEDHDSWHKEGLEFYARFYANLPEGLTPATMGEVAAWLDLKFPRPAHPAQALRLEDPLPRKGGVFFAHADTPRPADWPPDDGATHPFPPHVCYYDGERQLIYVEGEAAPHRYINYRRAAAGVPETGVIAAEALPKIDVRHLAIRAEGPHVLVEYDLYAAAPYTGFPLAVWWRAEMNESGGDKDLSGEKQSRSDGKADAKADAKADGNADGKADDDSSHPVNPPDGALALPGGFVIFLDVEQGANHGVWRAGLNV